VKEQAIPSGYRTITPYFAVPGAPGLIAFLKEAFGAEEIERHTTPDGTVMNAELKIGDSMVMLGEAPPEHKPMAAMLYMYVADADALYKRAMQAGAKSVRAMADQSYGDRVGAVEDPCGNQWWIATRL
jgi:PhnB protein